MENVRLDSTEVTMKVIFICLLCTDVAVPAGYNAQGKSVSDFYAFSTLKRDSNCLTEFISSNVLYYRLTVDIAF